MPTALESLLDPIDRDRFRDQYYGRQPLLVRGHAGKFADLFTWADLNRLLNASTYPHANIGTVRPGKYDQPAHASALVEQCRAGASLLFNQLHLFDPKVGDFARALEVELGEPMSAALLLSQPGHAAFPRHFDRDDQFVLQIYGDKSWSVYGLTVEKPIAYFAEKIEDAPTDPELQCELTAGDLLYIPRGHWHEALAQHTVSLHLVLGITARTGIDFLTWLAGELQNDVRCRNELPLTFAGEPTELREERLRRHAIALADIVRARVQDEATIRSFIQSCETPPRDAACTFDFPAQLDGNAK